MKTGGIRRLTPMGDTPYKMATYLHQLATATTTNLITVSYTKNYNTLQTPGQKQKSSTKINYNTLQTKNRKVANTKINFKNDHKVDKGPF